VYQDFFFITLSQQKIEIEIIRNSVIGMFSAVPSLKKQSGHICKYQFHVGARNCHLASQWPVSLQ
jgi:hypothetical protein